MTGYFSISKFAHLCETSRDTLLYYDKINLLKPFLIESNNYRYYTFAQYDTYLLIDSLKQVGTPLTKIRELLEERTAPHLLSLMNETEKNLETQIQKLTERKKVLTREKEEITNALKNRDSCQIVQLKECPIITYEYPIGSDISFSHALLKINHLIKEKELLTNYSPGCYGFFSQYQETEKGFVTYAGIYANVLTSSFHTTIRKKGSYIVLYTYTDFTDEVDIFKKVFAYAKIQKRTLGESYYQETLGCEFTKDGNSLYLSKYMFSVQ